MLNLRKHKADFGVDANRTFFATSHNKSPCDEIGGTVKRLTAHASLQRPYAEQILTVPSMVSFCQENIHGVLFFHISKDKMEDVRAELKPRSQWVAQYREQEITTFLNHFRPASSHTNARLKMTVLQVHSGENVEAMNK